VVVVVGVGCFGLNLAHRCRAAEARLLHVLKGLTRTPQVEEEVGVGLVQHPDVIFLAVFVCMRSPHGHLVPHGHRT